MMFGQTLREATDLVTWLGLPLLLGCRSWKTGRLLEGMAA